MTSQWTTPGQRWRLLAPAGAEVVDLPSRPLAIRGTVRRLRALPCGSPVIVLDHRPGSHRTRRLAAVRALTVDREYIALPSLRAALVIAEDSRDSLLWTCRSLVTPPPGSARAHRLAHAAVALLRRFPALASRLAARPGRRGQDSMTAHAICAPADQRREPDLRALVSRPGTRTVLLDSSRDPNAGVTMLLIPAGSDRPELAVKVATTPEAARVIAREARLLAALQRLPLSPVAPAIPKPAGLFHVDGMLAAATTAVPGVPMRTRYHGFGHLRRPEAVRADFAAAGGWLADLHTASAAEVRPISLLDGVPGLVTARWPGDPQARALAGLLDPLAARLARRRTPRTVVHGDFWAGNVLVADAGKAGLAVTGVVDWPAGQLTGEPLADVARFALTYALYLDRHTRPGRPVAGHPGLRAGRWGAGLEYAIAGEHWFGALVNEFVTGALHRLGTPATSWRDVLLAGIADVAVTADHPDFARRHRDLLLRLLSEEGS